MTVVESDTPESAPAKPTVVFFPWASIEASSTPEGIELRHYASDDTSWPDDVHRILAAYERSAGQKVESATIVAYDGAVGAPLTDAQVDAAFSLRQALAFVALRQREFFASTSYCNSHSFACVAQAYVPGSPGATAISRRRDGQSMLYLGEEYHRVICPHHVRAESEFKLNSPLLLSLLKAIGDRAEDWLIDGIELFNLANTDSPETPSPTEVILTVASAQRLLGVSQKSDAVELAQHFADTLYGAVPPQLSVGECSRTKGGKARSIAQAWFYDLYSDRGTVAHGRTRAISTRLWRRDEHLLLAAYILPRIALIRLAASGYYDLTEQDKEELAAFEYLLCLKNTFGSAKDGVDTGLPEGLHHHVGAFAWPEALWASKRERQIKQFLLENPIEDDEA